MIPLRLFVSLLSTCVCARSALAQAAAPTIDRPLAITHVTVIDATGAAARSDRTVVIAGNRIEAIVDASARIPKGARIVSAKGKFLIPGLWDMHVHLAASDLPRLVANGVTGVRDMGNVLANVDVWRGKIAAGSMVGPHIVRVGPILNGKAFGAAQVLIESDAEARAAVRILKNVGVDQIKVHQLLSREAYFALADEAKKLSIPFVGHIPESITAAEASDAGQASIEHVETLFAGKTPLKREETAAVFAQFVKNNTAFDPTLIEYRGSTDPANVDPRLMEKYPGLLSGRQKLFTQFLELVGMMNRAGVALLAGTDLGVKWISPGPSLHDELALLVQAGLTPMEALQAATRNPARFLHIEGGTVEAGKSANLVLLNANPLEDIRNTRRIYAVVLEGRFFDRSQLDALLSLPRPQGKRQRATH
jgi:imidazolonepropionase-like amidohydrolase